MKRKIIGQRNSLTITLPKKWVDEKGIKSGDEIDVEEENTDLLISTHKGKKIKEISIQLDKEDKSRIRTIISSAYRRGYDQVTLTSKQDFSFIEINQIVDSLIGYVITEQTNNKIIIKNIMADEFEDVSSILNKLLITIKFFISSVVEYLESEKNDKSELSELMKSIMKLRDYCQRMIHLTTYKGDKCYEYNTFVFVVEKLAGNFNDFVDIKQKKKTKKKIIIELKDKVDLFSQLYTCFMKKNIDLAIKLNNKLSKLRKETYYNQEHTFFSAIIENLFSLSSRIIGILI